MSSMTQPVYPMYRNRRDFIIPFKTSCTLPLFMCVNKVTMVLKLSLLRPPSQIESTNSYVTYFLVILPEAHLLRIPSGVRIRRSF